MKNQQPLFFLQIYFIAFHRVTLFSCTLTSYFKHIFCTLLSCCLNVHRESKMARKQPVFDNSVDFFEATLRAEIFRSLCGYIVLETSEKLLEAKAINSILMPRLTISCFYIKKYAFHFEDIVYRDKIHMVYFKCIRYFYHLLLFFLFHYNVRCFILRQVINNKLQYLMNTDGS